MTHLPEGLPELPLGEDGLGWHALNYRTAYTVHAHAMWEELERFVMAYGLACYQAGLERAAQIAEGIDEDNEGWISAAIRAEKTRS